MDEQVPASSKVYSPRQIYVASFIGGPLSGGWFLSRNYRAISNSPAAIRSLVAGWAIVVALFPLMFVLPEKIPNYVIPIAYSAGFYYFAKPRFSPDAARGIGIVSGWRQWLKIIGISLCWLALTFALWVGGGILFGQFFPGIHPGPQ
jgi:hypothetical protein